ncbi:MAG: 4-alpha-glucanotransferase [Planctomycetales bacterium]|nr:4-alpha-glucanotransferase [Planctomycetales bacterium]
MTPLPEPLKELAECYGVLTEYWDVNGQLRVASVESLLAVLQLLGANVSSVEQAAEAITVRRENRAQRVLEPVIVVWQGDAAEFVVTLPRGDTPTSLRFIIDIPGGLTPIDLKWNELREVPADFAPSDRYSTRVVRIDIPAQVTPGYWPLTLECNGRQHKSLLMHAPRQAFGPPASGQAWGCFMPVYSIRSQHNWGAGDYTDLRHLAEWIGGQGGRVLGTLPLLAGFLDEPCDPSPYAPATRLFWNEFYIDVERVPELAHCEPARNLIGSSAFQQELTGCREGEYIDYQRLMKLKRSVLELLADTMPQQSAERQQAWRVFIEQTPQLEEYATFRAVHERERRPWWLWEPRLRSGDLRASDYDAAARDYHLYAQWIASEQLERTLREGQAAGGETAQLYLDLPLGVRRDAYDVWRNRDIFITQSSVGAPPDAIFTGGQNWGFCPLHPDAVRESGYTHVRHYLSRHMHASRMLRIDHVMGLHRLFWIPDGRPASDGVYVRYRADEFYAILSLESHRHRTCVLGENLGTVPPGVNEAMDEHAIRRMFVVQYELQGDQQGGNDPSQPPFNAPPSNAVASLNTHDMPMFSAWWRGEDIDDRRAMDLMDDAGRDEEHRIRSELREALTRWTRITRGIEPPSASDVLTALLTHLAESSAELLLVNLEDLWQETRPQNIPGTWKERPNWRRRASRSLEQLNELQDVLNVLEAVRAARG